MRLQWHDYKYYPYERELASREASSLIEFAKLQDAQDGIELQDTGDHTNADRLTYFKGYQNGGGFVPTTQSELEISARNGRNRQATRYSVHGLHEYKGKFNPQVARALLNIFHVTPGQSVLDPFCGSGTTLIECSHLGIDAVGTDINPLAVYLSNAKLCALSASVESLKKVQRDISDHLLSTRKHTGLKSSDERQEYLLGWFDQDIYVEIENMRKVILDIAGDLSPIFLAIASNLLRDYSQQDPRDLRIRRRTSPLPSEPYTKAFLSAVSQVLGRILATREVIGTGATSGRALLCDVSELMQVDGQQRFDAAITSPPYAMALPYIDTQRLSLVWLGLLPADQILELEASLIGSRELRGSSKRELPKAMALNEADLPTDEYDLCVTLANSLSESDGFRRRAVPSLLYRYFAAMKTNFRSVNALMKAGAPYALIVGHNHTTIGGIRYDIDTPSHLANLAVSVGWSIDELIPLQTYKRYGYHVSNAVAAETLIILRKA
ncbi:DNA methyltransferase [uncultured Jannaschia sp.]|uniref:TRM11 family SAM-dependent methyltransferase n=1 Tax=uncultured Jannaschia sp. TaxID=293347 RepID=UPI0026367845|nr:DNA methyltransferase [uncultured Jannaschia sp.]